MTTYYTRAPFGIIVANDYDSGSEHQMTITVLHDGNTDRPVPADWVENKDNLLASTVSILSGLYQQDWSGYHLIESVRGPEPGDITLKVWVP